MSSRRKLLSLLVAVGLGSLMSPPLAWPLLYQCREASGATVFTDSTAQLQHCQLINSGATTRFSHPIGAAAAPIVVPVEPEATRLPDPSDLMVQPVAVPPAEDDTLPASQSLPPCVAGINPLNPFRGPGCTPTQNTVTVQPDLPPEPGSDGSPP